MLTPLVIGHVCGFNATFWVSPSSPEPPPQLRLTASILFARPPACLKAPTFQRWAPGSPPATGSSPGRPRLSRGGFLFPPRCLGPKPSVVFLLSCPSPPSANPAAHHLPGSLS